MKYVTKCTNIPTRVDVPTMTQLSPMTAKPGKRSSSHGVMAGCPVCVGNDLIAAAVSITDVLTHGLEKHAPCLVDAAGVSSVPLL